MDNTEPYVVLYGDKKPEDIIMIKNMFKHTKKINLGWIEIDYINNMKIIEELISQNNKQIIFWGMEIGWDKLIENIKMQYKDIVIKVICNTNDSLLYYDYERSNFFKMLELSKKGIIDKIAFLRKSQYESYKKIGYNCCCIKENYKLNKKVDLERNDNDVKQIGIYPLNYTWDKNIFNQLCIAKFIDDSNLNYNCLDERMKEFLNTMQIKSNVDNIETIDEDSIIECIRKNDIIVATSFTEYVHPIFFISMELGIPCLIGNNSDFFENDTELNKYIVTNTEDNPIINSKKVQYLIENKEEIMSLYADWKRNYNSISENTLKEFLEDDLCEVK